MSSVFSGGAGRRAAIWGAGYLEDQQQKIDDKITSGTGQAVTAIDQGQGRSLASLRSGYNKDITAIKTAQGMFNPYAQTGLAAFNQYADASGVNGQAGYDQVVNNFRASPGYQYQVDQATDATARKASSLGALGSGNTMQAISTQAGHMADQEYDDYLSRLNGIATTGYNATQQQAALQKGIGDLHYNYGQNRATIYDNNATERSNIYSHGMDASVNTTANTASNIAQIGMQGMRAGQDAAATRMNFGLQAAGTALKLLSLPMSGGGSLGGNLFG